MRIFFFSADEKMVACNAQLRDEGTDRADVYGPTMLHEQEHERTCVRHRDSRRGHSPIIAILKIALIF